MRSGGPSARRLPSWGLRQIQNTRAAFNNNAPLLVTDPEVVGVVFSERGQDVPFQRFHRLRGGRPFVVMAMRVQCGVHDQMGEVVVHWLAACARFALECRYADDDVGVNGRLGRVTEGQHIGGVVLAAKVAVKSAPFARVDEAQGQLGVAD